MPLLLQVCTAAFPEHCVAPGVQDPVHTPAEHTELLQATGDPHMPVALHVSTLFAAVIEHRVAPGEHDPVQAPPTHAELTHVDGAPQFPVESHVETPLTEPPSAPVAHSVAPGEHTPWQEAVPTGPTHAWLVHAAAVPHAPAAVQVCSAALPEHCVCPGAQTPPHDAVCPTTRHVVFVQVEGVPHIPVALQVATALSDAPPASVAHSVAPGEHTPWHAPELPFMTHA
jgi:hypothetical protein